MTFIEQMQRLERLDYLIRSRATGTPSELAKKLGLSQSQMFQIMKAIKEKMEAPVCYSRAEQSYYYGEDVRFVWGFYSEN
ncbi:MAG TPA: hypothetical protein VHO50_00500 [Bacteroidales bacterium]|nr:hypothetical protein [Bacteroidales bacterium]